MQQAIPGLARFVNRAAPIDMANGPIELARGDLRLLLAQTKATQKSLCLPKLFLRLPTKIQASDYPPTLTKPFFHFSLVDNKEVRFYHLHWEFLRVLGQNPPLSARLLNPPAKLVILTVCSTVIGSAFHWELQIGKALMPPAC